MDAIFHCMIIDIYDVEKEERTLYIKRLKFEANACIGYDE